MIKILLRNADYNISGNTIDSNNFAVIALDNADSNIINGSKTITGNHEGWGIIW